MGVFLSLIGLIVVTSCDLGTWYQKSAMSNVSKASFGGYTFSDIGKTSNSPNRLRIHGVWSGKHIESGTPFHLKFFIIQEFNADGKVITLNEWFDPSSIGDQIDAFLSKESK